MPPPSADSNQSTGMNVTFNFTVTSPTTTHATVMSICGGANAARSPPAQAWSSARKYAAGGTLGLDVTALDEQFPTLQQLRHIGIVQRRCSRQQSGRDQPHQCKLSASEFSHTHFYPPLRRCSHKRATSAPQRHRCCLPAAQTARGGDVLARDSTSTVETSRASKPPATCRVIRPAPSAVPESPSSDSEYFESDEETPAAAGPAAAAHRVEVVMNQIALNLGCMGPIGNVAAVPAVSHLYEQHLAVGNTCGTRKLPNRSVGGGAWLSAQFFRGPTDQQRKVLRCDDQPMLRLQPACDGCIFREPDSCR